MPYRVILEGEARDEVDGVNEPTNTVVGLDQLLASVDQQEFSALPYIDAYGMTIFNRLQISEFLREWNTLRGRTSDSELLEFMGRVADFGERVLQEPHLYLRFSGD